MKPSKPVIVVGIVAGAALAAFATVAVRRCGDDGACGGRAVEEHLNRATTAMASLSYTAALGELDAVLACTPDDTTTLQRAYKAACGTGQRPRIRELYGKLVAAGFEPMAMKRVCFDFGIDPTK